MKTYMVTSHDFSWLQNGQLNCLSSGTIAFLFGGGFDFFFLLPILEVSVPEYHQLNYARSMSTYLSIFYSKSSLLLKRIPTLSYLN